MQENKLIQLYNESDELYHALSVYYGISESTLFILYMLVSTQKALTPTELAKMCALTKQTVHSSLQALEKNSYIRLTSSDKNRKNKLVSLTDKGQELAKKTVIPVYHAEQRAFSRLSAREREQLVSLTNKYQQNLREEFQKLLKIPAENNTLH